MTTKPPAAPEPQKPAPAAEMPEGWRYSPAIGGAFVSKRDDGGQYAITLTLLRALLATQGLRVVPESECLPAPFTVRMISEHGYKLVPPEACRVLEAMARAHRLQLTTILEHDTGNGDPLIEAARAELARREDL